MLRWCRLVVALTILQAGLVHAQDGASDGTRDTTQDTTRDTTQDTTQEAKQAFGAGVQAFDAGDYGAALGHFERANALKPHPLVRVNIANCYVKLGDPLEALVHFEAFLASGEGQPAQRDEVQAEVDRLLKQIGSAELLIHPGGATVRIDGGEALTAPLPGIQRLTPGRHRIEVSLEGYAPYAGHFTTRRGQKVTVQVSLQPAVIATPPADLPTDELVPELEEAPDAASTEPNDQARGLSVRSWIALAATGVLLTGSIVTGIVALSADDDFRTNARIANDTGASASLRQEAWLLGRDAHDAAVSLAATSDVLLVGALVGGGLSAYFIHDDLSYDEHAGRTRILPVARRDGGGVMLSGTF